MQTKTVTAVANVLPALATVAHGATRTARRGKSLRCYRAPELLTAESHPELTAAFSLLLRAGHSVKVFAGEHVYSLKLDGDTVVWQTRAARRERDYVCVEVTL